MELMGDDPSLGSFFGVGPLGHLWGILTDVVFVFLCFVGWFWFS